jgi:hypothetical protein
MGEIAIAVSLNWWTYRFSFIQLRNACNSRSICNEIDSL